MKSLISFGLCALLLFVSHPAKSEGFLNVVAGDSWAWIEVLILESFLGRPMVNDTLPGMRAADVVADPTLLSTPQAGDMIYLSLGGLDVLDGTPQELRQANLLTIIWNYMQVPLTRVVHVGYNGVLPDPTPDTIAMLTALWPDRYRWIDMRYLDDEPYVWAQENDPLHLYFWGYQLRTGAILSELIQDGWRP